MGTQAEQLFQDLGMWHAALRAEERKALASVAPSCRPTLRGLEDIASVVSRERLRDFLKASVAGDQSLSMQLTPASPGGWTPYWEHLCSHPAAGSSVGRLSPPETNSIAHRLAPSLISHATRLLGEQLAAIATTDPNLSFDCEAIMLSFSQELEQFVTRTAMRTFVLEMHISRLEGTLQGDSPEERFQFFLNRFNDPGQCSRFFDEYALLSRDLVDVAECMVRSCVETCRRLKQDRALVAELISGSQTLRVSHVGQGLGDRHCGGRTVSVIWFQDGKKVVYKPRSLAGEYHFQDLIRWLNQRLPMFPLSTIGIIDQGDYGWTEYVSATAVEDEKQLSHFYRRLGRLLCLLQVLQASDFHYENLIAAGDQPVLIDCESLFNGEMTCADSDLESPISRFLAHSVLNTGLLPRRSLMGNGFENSGIGGAAGQIMPHPRPQWEATFRDDMHLVHREVAFGGARNQPSVKDKQFDVESFCRDVVLGFSEAYQVLLDNKKVLLSAGSPLQAFRSCRTRVILRPTMVYAKMLHDCRHPDLLRQADVREQHIRRMMQTRPAQFPSDVVAAELEDLLDGDIPYFYTSPDSKVLWSRKGTSPGFFNKTGWECSRETIERLSQRDLSIQTDLIRASLASLSPVLHSAAPTGSCDKPSEHPNEDALRLAEQIGLQLHALAISVNHDPRWVGLTLSESQCWTVQELGLDLYSGVPGIVLFLSTLSRYSFDDRIARLAERSCTSLLNMIEKNMGAVQTIGAYAGVGGIIFSLVRLARIWPEKGLLELATSIAESIPPLIDGDAGYDMVYGSAGCLASLLALEKESSSPVILDLARQCADHLVKGAQKASEGSGWITPIARKRPLGGFSHGIAGIAWPLIAFGTRVNDKQYLESASEALAYERSLFSAESGNWLDLRDNGVFGKNCDSSAFVAWCHGASGIGFSRCNMFGLLQDPLLLNEIRTALASTMARGFGSNHSLCHGDLGNLEAAMVASKILGNSDCARDLGMISAKSIGRIARAGWICGNPGPVDSPGLMTGLAGIGYGLLRLSKPAEVPTVLCPYSSSRVEGVEWQL